MSKKRWQHSPLRSIGCWLMLVICVVDWQFWLAATAQPHKRTYHIPLAQERIKIQSTVSTECLLLSHHCKVTKLLSWGPTVFCFQRFLFSLWKPHTKRQYSNSTKGDHKKMNPSLYPRLPSLLLNIKSSFSLLPENFSDHTHKSSCEGIVLLCTVHASFSLYNVSWRSCHFSVYNFTSVF